MSLVATLSSTQHNSRSVANNTTSVHRFLFAVFQLQQQQLRTKQHCRTPHFRSCDIFNGQSHSNQHQHRHQHDSLDCEDCIDDDDDNNTLNTTMPPHMLEFEQPSDDVCTTSIQEQNGAETAKQSSPPASPVVPVSLASVDAGVATTAPVAAPPADTPTFRRQRSVEFSGQNTVHPIDHFRDYSPAEQSNIWMSRYELQAVRRSCIEKVRELNLIYAESSNSNSNSNAEDDDDDEMQVSSSAASINNEEEKKEEADAMDVDDATTTIDNETRFHIAKIMMMDNSEISHDDIRGLESYTQANLERSKTARAMAREAVFGMQKFQKFKGTKMPELLAEVYANSCVDSLKQAQGMALMDAEYANRS